nr:MAG TPA: hypothetical protein [Caudoviricetes sp.]
MAAGEGFERSLFLINSLRHSTFEIRVHFRV